MEELKKEIESLKRKTLYLFTVIIAITITFIGLCVRQLQMYSTIQDYYFESLEADRELNQNLFELNQILEESFSSIQ